MNTKIKTIINYLGGAFIAVSLTLVVYSYAQFAPYFLPEQGGTGTSTAPAFGEILVGNSGGTYDIKATSTLGIDLSDTTGSITESRISDLSHLTEEQVEDYVGGMLGGTETLITVTYQDSTNDIDFVVDNDLANYSNTNSDFVNTTTLLGYGYNPQSYASSTYVWASDWTTIDNYPTACSSGEFVRGIGDTLTCATDDTGTDSADDLSDDDLDALQNVAAMTEANGDILYYNTGAWQKLAKGSDGEVLKLASGLPSWGTDNSGSGGGSGFWATSTNDLSLYPVDTSHVVLVGENSTSTWLNDVSFESYRNETANSGSWANASIVTTFKPTSAGYTTNLDGLDILLNIDGTTAVNSATGASGEVGFPRASRSRLYVSSDTEFNDLYGGLHVVEFDSGSSASSTHTYGSHGGVFNSGVGTHLENVWVDFSEYYHSDAGYATSVRSYYSDASILGGYVDNLISYSNKDLATYITSGNLGNHYGAILFGNSRFGNDYAMPNETLEVVGNVDLKSENSSSSLMFNDTIAIQQKEDGFLRINDSTQFASGIYLGSSPLRLDGNTSSGLLVGNAGGSGSQIRLLPSGGDYTNRINLWGGTGEIEGQYLTASSTSATSTIAGNIDVQGNSQLGTIIQGTWNGSVIDISTYTNLSVSATGLELSGDAIALSAGYVIATTTRALNWDSAYAQAHVAVTLAGEDYLSLSTQQITANAINPDNLASADFGDFTCNGTTCTLDASYLLTSDYYSTTTHATITSIPNLSITESQISDLTHYTDTDAADYINASTTILNGNTEGELEGFLSGVTNVFTNNDGALNDDNLGDDPLDALQNVAALTESTGDILYFNSNWNALGIGTEGQVLKVSAGGLPTWGTDNTGGAGGDSGWSTSTAGSDILLYPVSATYDVMFGDSTATSTAPFWWDVSATSTYIGNGGAGDSSVQLGDDDNAWTIGYDDTDKSFVIASSTALGTSNVFVIDKPTGAISTGTWQGSVIAHEYGGLETDVSAYTGLLAVSGGSTSEVDTISELNAQISDATLLQDGCSDCLNATEIEDIYLLNSGDTSSGNYTLTGVIDISGGVLEIPNAANPTVDAAGEMALDTTDNQLLVADSGNTARVFARAEQPLFSITVASSSVEFVSGGVIPIAKNVKDGRDITQFRCYVDGGTSIVMNVSDGTNDTETITCATTVTSDTDVATNSTFTADEKWELQFGTITGSPDYLVFEAYGYITRE